MKEIIHILFSELETKRELKLFWIAMIAGLIIGTGTAFGFCLFIILSI